MDKLVDSFEQYIPTNRPSPIMVTRQRVSEYFAGLSAKTLANLACDGEGPPYFKRGKIVWYQISDIENWLTAYPVQTSDVNQNQIQFNNGGEV